MTLGIFQGHWTVSHQISQKTVCDTAKVTIANNRKPYTSFRLVPLLMTLNYIWRSFHPRLLFSRQFQQSLACFRVARSPSNSWASCSFVNKISRTWAAFRPPTNGAEIPDMHYKLHIGFIYHRHRRHHRHRFICSYKTIMRWNNCISLNVFAHLSWLEHCDRFTSSGMVKIE